MLQLEFLTPLDCVVMFAPNPKRKWGLSFISAFQLPLFFFLYSYEWVLAEHAVKRERSKMVRIGWAGKPILE